MSEGDQARRLVLFVAYVVCAAKGGIMNDQAQKRLIITVRTISFEQFRNSEKVVKKLAEFRRLTTTGSLSLGMMRLRMEALTVRALITERYCEVCGSEIVFTDETLKQWHDARRCPACISLPQPRSTPGKRCSYCATYYERKQIKAMLDSRKYKAWSCCNNCSPCLRRQLMTARAWAERLIPVTFGMCYF